ncbi:hypothetical protein AB0B45_14720 [Nonomuraea sp. NPDC049152]|uniref:hypothetical protein n=1 Tax=Nonomuraea sp. NPDC049152 TaxID=3154350 RepID=UPI0033DE6416
MGKFKNGLMAIGGIAMVGGLLAAGTGTSSAASEIGFRLSNFNSLTVTLCVNTGTDRDCLRDSRFNGQSEVRTLSYASLNTWRCSVVIRDGFGKVSESYATKPFSRNEFKECLVHNGKILLKRPNGTEIVAPRA